MNMCGEGDIHRRSGSSLSEEGGRALQVGPGIYMVGWMAHNGTGAEMEVLYARGWMQCHVWGGPVFPSSHKGGGCTLDVVWHCGPLTANRSGTVRAGMARARRGLTGDVAGKAARRSDRTVSRNLCVWLRSRRMCQRCSAGNWPERGMRPTPILFSPSSGTEMQEFRFGSTSKRRTSTGAQGLSSTTSSATTRCQIPHLRPSEGAVSSPLDIADGRYATPSDREGFLHNRWKREARRGERSQ